MATLLRLATAGSVRRRQVHLIGRLLYDSKPCGDQWASVERASEERARVHRLSLVTDGLRASANRASRSTSLPLLRHSKRKFIIADTRGHIQYTRNMVTGASTAQL